MAQELNIHLETGGNTPLYRQIYEYIRGEIRSGALASDERLPSTRALASYLQVARSTTELAYSQLLSEGYIRSRRNSGYFVNEIENFPDLRLDDPMDGESLYGTRRGTGGSGTEQRKPEDKNLFTSRAARAEGLADDGKEGRGSSPNQIDFSLRHTEMSVFPYSTWKRIMREVMAGADQEMFSHSEPGGDLSLRSTIAHYLHFSRGVHCRPEQIIVGAGNDYLLMLLRHILGEGRLVAMEDPTYLRAARIFLSFRYRICPLSMDRDGMLPGSVEKSGADLVYTMPAHQFPMGCVMPVARRTALLRWACEQPERYIIEDDYDSEFRYRGKPIPALQSLDTAGRVIYIGTFSKAIAPAIRVSYMILPEELLRRYRERCWFLSSTVSRIDQRILNEFMHNGHFERHLNRMRSLYRTRHDELVSSLVSFRKWFSVRGTGTGLHLVLQCRKEYLLKEGFTQNIIHSLSAEGAAEVEHILAERALAAGVRVYCVSDFLLPGQEMPAGKELNSGSSEGEMSDYGDQETGCDGKMTGGGDMDTGSGSQDSARNERHVYPAVLLGFGALSPEQIRRGVGLLAKAWNIPETG
ncbi:MAG: PLP-dependent aminotransferase family protein [Lachnospiraceae bacterium]|nr:PLP-dependent aminotransferase family protein [Lachnospiraceae bacterium]